MKVFGINEFSSRFSTWLLHVASCALIGHFACRERSLRVGLTAAITYSTCTLGFLSSGAVLTDGALALALLLAHLGVWRGLMHGDRRWAMAGFLGLGLGLLAIRQRACATLGDNLGAPAGRAFALGAVFTDAGQAARAI